MSTGQTHFGDPGGGGLLASERAGELLGVHPDEQRRRGYFHTLCEILQQPRTWVDTSRLVADNTETFRRALDGAQSVVLTGSGSSEFAGYCVRLVLQSELNVVTQVIGGGMLLTHGSSALPPQRPALMISLARSGDSPESTGAVSLALEIEPQVRHLIITCNQRGSLATAYSKDPRVQVVSLHDRTNDRSLVMTSSFTNMVLAARYLGLLNRPEQYQSICARLCTIGADLLQRNFDTLARVARSGFRRVVFLGSGSRWGAARESSLKMLEMTAGRVSTICETYLGLRHGPMSYVHDDTLVVCFFSSDPLLRAYESDLIRELDRKELGSQKLIVGEHVPPELVRKKDVVIELPGLAELGDENAPVLDAIVGQVLAFFRCMEEGLQPDSPSADGVINRVVESFTIHRAPR